ncbi:MAG: 1-acyl-sn-glycerol-3-phosphate acyltransferase [Clostridia bacterium]|nr:1-acyl-sn-glycerol-3-phosphate acyltransferase [Clostridia bacterium]
MHYKKPNKFFYRLVQFISFFLCTFIFRRKVVRNEIRGVKGPYVVIANHECALDFVTLIGLNRRPMSFVISNSFYSTLPVQGIMDKIGVIPKQQFQTTSRNLKQIKAVIDNGEPLVIYPAGLMCEDGLSTPIPLGTYKFLKWLGVDVYCAKVKGSYFVMPKWSKGFNPGKIEMDIFKVFDKEELNSLSVEEVKERTREALLFNAYKDQDERKYSYRKKGEISGMENVLYVCPDCGKEFTMELKNPHTLKCSECGYEAESDAYYMLERKSENGPELRYVSDWNKMILKKVSDELSLDTPYEIKEETDIQMVNKEKKKFESVGNGVVTLTKDCYSLKGTVNGEEISIELTPSLYPMLPYSPGKYFELQDKDTIYRLVLKNGRMVQKCVNTIKMNFRLLNNITDEFE